MLKVQGRSELVSDRTAARVTQARISSVCMESAGMSLECANIQDWHHKKVLGDDGSSLRPAKHHCPGQKFIVQKPVNGSCFAGYIYLSQKQGD